MKKRDLGLVLLVAALLAASLMVGAAPAQAAASPDMPHWVDPLPVPPVAQKTFKPGVSSWADYYEIDMRASQHQFNAGLGPATVWTYAQPGQNPVLLGPTIVAQSGRPIVVKWINNLPTDPADFPLKDSIDPTIAGADVPTGAAIPHLHGGHSAARFDGTPMQWWTADGLKGEDYVTDTFTYVNDQPASLSWYHDHTMGATRFKPYLGLAAGYLIFDKVDNGTTINGQRVPTGYGKYHLPLVIQDKQFNADGTPVLSDGRRRRRQRRSPGHGCRSSSPTRRSSTARRTRTWTHSRAGTGCGCSTARRPASTTSTSTRAPAPTCPSGSSAPRAGCCPRRSRRPTS